MKQSLLVFWLIQGLIGMGLLPLSARAEENSSWEVNVWNQSVDRAQRIENAIEAHCSNGNLTSLIQCFQLNPTVGQSAGEFILSFSTFLSTTSVVADGLNNPAAAVPGRFLNQVLLLELSNQVRSGLLDRKDPMLRDVNLSNEFSIAVQSIDLRSRSEESRRFLGSLNDLSLYPEEFQLRPSMLVEARRFVNVLRLLRQSIESTRECAQSGYDETANLSSIYGLLGGSYFNSFKNAAPRLAHEVVNAFQRVCKFAENYSDKEWGESVRRLRKFRAQSLALISQK